MPWTNEFDVEYGSARGHPEQESSFRHRSAPLRRRGTRFEYVLVPSSRNGHATRACAHEPRPFTIAQCPAPAADRCRVVLIDRCAIRHRGGEFNGSRASRGRRRSASR
jgi:hypothetical protein